MYQEEAVNALCQLGRDIVAGGMVRGSGGNLSIRLDDHILISATGQPLDQLTPDSLVPLSLDGECLREGGKPSSEWQLHVAVYRLWPQVQVVVHAHPPYAIAWGALGQPIRPLTSDTYLHLGPYVPLVPYITPTTAALAEAVAEAFRAHASPAVLLQNHGVVVLGETVAKARVRLEVLEDTARMLLLAHAAGTPRMLTPDDMAALDEATQGRYAFKRSS